MLENFETYLKKAEDIIVQDFLELYNDGWCDPENGFPQYKEQEFRNKLELSGISFLSTDLISVFFTESGMFGNHALIAECFDGENFEDSSMFG